MLTPRFVLSQTDDDLIITIHAPYANISETEIYVHESDVRFHSSPYYLRLNLPGSVEENNGSRASYDADSGDFVIRLGKTIHGQHFPDLDMITKLLAPKPSSVHDSQSVVSPDISIVGNAPVDGSDSDSENEEIEWFIEQVPMNDDDDIILDDQITYGFANSKHSVFKKIESEFPKLIDLPEPDVTPERERERLRVEHEMSSFNEGHYLADLMDACDKDSTLHSALAFKGPWETHPDIFATFTESNRDVLKDLPNKEYLMDEKERISFYLGIVDLVFAYAYDQRSTEGEGTVESGWTMAKLSPMLSWLQTFSSLDSLVLSCLRRSLCYPLYRHWKLSLKVLNDTRCILRMGKVGILKCLLYMHAVFNGNEPQYILNQLYIRDYCIWIQKASVKRIESLAEALDKFSPKKKDLGLGLEELEIVVCKAQEVKGELCDSPSKTKSSEKSVDNVGHCLSKMAIGGVLEEAVSDSDDSTSLDDSSSSEESLTSSEESDEDDDDDDDDDTSSESYVEDASDKELLKNSISSDKETANT